MDGALFSCVIGRITNRNMREYGEMYYQMISTKLRCEPVVLLGAAFIFERVFHDKLIDHMWGLLTGCFMLSYKWFEDDHYSIDVVGGLFKNVSIASVKSWETYAFRQCGFCVYIDECNLTAFISKFTGCV